MNRKGIILAGGNGTRLHPLTYGATKALLPVYDKPLLYYPISTLLKFGIRHILIIGSSEEYIQAFKRAVKSIYGVTFMFALQQEAKGLSDAFLVGEKFIGSADVSLILGDNIFDGDFPALNYPNTIYGVKVKNPQDYGVIDIDNDFGFVKSVVEKPVNPPSDKAVPGLYHFDNSAIEKAKSIKPSPRGELEITDLINIYLQEGKMNVSILPEDMVWFDCGTHDHLLEAGNYVKAIQNRTSRIVGKV